MLENLMSTINNIIPVSIAMANSIELINEKWKLDEEYNWQGDRFYRFCVPQSVSCSPSKECYRSYDAQPCVTLIHDKSVEMGTKTKNSFDNVFHVYLIKGLQKNKRN
jgi:hypothetical protein